MKRINYLLPGILVSLVLLSFGCATVGKAADWTLEQKKIIAVMETWERAYNSGDVAKLDKLLVDEIDITSNPLGTFKDKASYLEAYRKWYAFGRAVISPVSTSITYVEIKVSSGDDDASVTRKIDWSQRGDRGLQQGTVTKTMRLKKWSFRIECG